MSIEKKPAVQVNNVLAQPRGLSYLEELANKATSQPVQESTSPVPYRNFSEYIKANPKQEYTAKKEAYDSIVNKNTREKPAQNFGAGIFSDVFTMIQDFGVNTHSVVTMSRPVAPALIADRREAERYSIQKAYESVGITFDEKGNISPRFKTVLASNRAKNVIYNPNAPFSAINAATNNLTPGKLYYYDTEQGVFIDYDVVKSDDLRGQEYVYSSQHEEYMTQLEAQLKEEEEELSSWAGADPTAPDSIIDAITPATLARYAGDESTDVLTMITTPKYYSAFFHSIGDYFDNYVLAPANQFMDDLVFSPVDTLLDTGKTLVNTVASLVQNTVMLGLTDWVPFEEEGFHSTSSLKIINNAFTSLSEVADYLTGANMVKSIGSALVNEDEDLWENMTSSIGANFDTGYRRQYDVDTGFRPFDVALEFLSDYTNIASIAKSAAKLSINKNIKYALDRALYEVAEYTPSARAVNTFRTSYLKKFEGTRTLASVFDDMQKSKLLRKMTPDQRAVFSDAFMRNIKEVQNTRNARIVASLNRFYDNTNTINKIGFEITKYSTTLGLNLAAIQGIGKLSSYVKAKWAISHNKMAKIAPTGVVRLADVNNNLPVLFEHCQNIVDILKEADPNTNIHADALVALYTSDVQLKEFTALQEVLNSPVNLKQRLQDLNAFAKAHGVANITEYIYMLENNKSSISDDMKGIADVIIKDIKELKYKERQIIVGNLRNVVHSVTTHLETTPETTWLSYRYYGKSLGFKVSKKVYQRIADKAVSLYDFVEAQLSNKNTEQYVGLEAAQVEELNALYAVQMYSSADLGAILDTLTTLLNRSELLQVFGSDNVKQIMYYTRIMGEVSDEWVKYFSLKSLLESTPPFSLTVYRSNAKQYATDKQLYTYLNSLSLNKNKASIKNVDLVSALVYNMLEDKLQNFKKLLDAIDAQELKVKNLTAKVELDKTTSIDAFHQAQTLLNPELADMRFIDIRRAYVKNQRDNQALLSEAVNTLQALQKEKNAVRKDIHAVIKKELNEGSVKLKEHMLVAYNKTKHINIANLLRTLEDTAVAHIPEGKRKPKVKSTVLPGVAPSSKPLQSFEDVIRKELNLPDNNAVTKKTIVSKATSFASDNGVKLTKNYFEDEADINTLITSLEDLSSSLGVYMPEFARDILYTFIDELRTDLFRQKNYKGVDDDVQDYHFLYKTGELSDAVTDELRTIVDVTRSNIMNSKTRDSLAMHDVAELEDLLEEFMPEVAPVDKSEYLTVVSKAVAKQHRLYSKQLSHVGSEAHILSGDNLVKLTGDIYSSKGLGTVLDMLITKAPENSIIADFARDLKTVSVSTVIARSIWKKLTNEKIFKDPLEREAFLDTLSDYARDPMPLNNVDYFTSVFIQKATAYMNGNAFIRERKDLMTAAGEGPVTRKRVAQLVQAIIKDKPIYEHYKTAADGTSDVQVLTNNYAIELAYGELTKRHYEEADKIYSLEAFRAFQNTSNSKQDSEITPVVGEVYYLPNTVPIILDLETTHGAEGTVTRVVVADMYGNTYDITSSYFLEGVADYDARKMYNYTQSKYASVFKQDRAESVADPNVTNYNVNTEEEFADTLKKVIQPMIDEALKHKKQIRLVGWGAGAHNRGSIKALQKLIRRNNLNLYISPNVHIDNVQSYALQWVDLAQEFLSDMGGHYVSYESELMLNKIFTIAKQNINTLNKSLELYGAKPATLMPNFNSYTTYMLEAYLSIFDKYMAYILHDKRRANPNLPLSLDKEQLDALEIPKEFLEVMAITSAAEVLALRDQISNTRNELVYTLAQIRNSNVLLGSEVINMAPIQKMVQGTSLQKYANPQLLVRLMRGSEGVPGLSLVLKNDPSLVRTWGAEKFYNTNWLVDVNGNVVTDAYGVANFLYTHVQDTKKLDDMYKQSGKPIKDIPLGELGKLNNLLRRLEKRAEVIKDPSILHEYFERYGTRLDVEFTIPSTARVKPLGYEYLTLIDITKLDAARLYTYLIYRMRLYMRYRKLNVAQLKEEAKLTQNYRLLHLLYIYDNEGLLLQGKVPMYTAQTEVYQTKLLHKENAFMSFLEESKEFDAALEYTNNLKAISLITENSPYRNPTRLIQEEIINSMESFINAVVDPVKAIQAEYQAELNRNVDLWGLPEEAFRSEALRKVELRQEYTAAVAARKEQLKVIANTCAAIAPMAILSLPPADYAAMLYKTLGKQVIYLDDAVFKDKTNKRLTKAVQNLTVIINEGKKYGIKSTYDESTKVLRIWLDKNFYYTKNPETGFWTANSNLEELKKRADNLQLEYPTDWFPQMNEVEQSFVKLMNALNKYTNNTFGISTHIAFTHKRYIELERQFPSQEDYITYNDLLDSNSLGNTFVCAVLGDYGRGGTIFEYHSPNVFTNVFNGFQYVFNNMHGIDNFASLFFNEKLTLRTVIKNIKQRNSPGFLNKKQLHEKVLEYCRNETLVACFLTDDESATKAHIKKTEQLKNKKRKDEKSTSGIRVINDKAYKVVMVDITSSEVFEKAIDAGVVLLPYTSYTKAVETINNMRFNSAVLNFINRNYLAPIKLGQIISPGTSLRNWVDSNTKAVLQAEDDKVGFLINRRDAKKDFHMFELTRAKLHRETKGLINKANAAEFFKIHKNNPDIMEEEYFWDNYQYFKNSAATITTAQETEMRNVAATLQRFIIDSPYYRDITRNMIQMAYDMFYLPDFKNNTNALQAAIEEKLKDRFEGEKLKGIAAELTYLKWRTNIQDYQAHPGLITKFLNMKHNPLGKLLDINTHIESFVRYSVYHYYRYYAGTSFDEAVKKVDESQFNVNPNRTSKFRKFLELLFPFSNFAINNVKFWLDLLDYNNLNNVKLFEAYMQGYNDMEDDPLSYEELMNNLSLQYAWLNGNIVIEDWGGLTLKLNNSFMDVMQFLADPLNTIEERINAVPGVVGGLIRRAGYKDADDVTSLSFDTMKQALAISEDWTSGEYDTYNTTYEEYLAMSFEDKEVFLKRIRNMVDMHSPVYNYVENLLDRNKVPLHKLGPLGITQEIATLIPIVGALYSRYSNAWAKDYPEDYIFNQVFKDVFGTGIDFTLNPATVEPSIFSYTRLEAAGTYTNYNNKPVGYNWYEQTDEYRATHRYVPGVSYKPTWLYKNPATYINTFGRLLKLGYRMSDVSEMMADSWWDKLPHWMNAEDGKATFFRTMSELEDLGYTIKEALDVIESGIYVNLTGELVDRSVQNQEDERNYTQLQLYILGLATYPSGYVPKAFWLNEQGDGFTTEDGLPNWITRDAPSYQRTAQHFLSEGLSLDEVREKMAYGWYVNEKNQLVDRSEQNRIDEDSYQKLKLWLEDKDNNEYPEQYVPKCYRINSRGDGFTYADNIPKWLSTDPAVFHRTINYLTSLDFTLEQMKSFLARGYYVEEDNSVAWQRNENRRQNYTHFSFSSNSYVPYNSYEFTGRNGVQYYTPQSQPKVKPHSTYPAASAKYGKVGVTSTDPYKTKQNKYRPSLSSKAAYPAAYRNIGYAYKRYANRFDAVRVRTVQSRNAGTYLTRSGVNRPTTPGRLRIKRNGYSPVRNLTR